MSAGWKFFRVICLLQLILTVFSGVRAFINFFEYGSFAYLLAAIFYFLICWLAIMGLNLMTYNYPDKPVAGRQKTIFNWLFLLNFLLLAFLFGMVFSEYRQLRLLSIVIGRRIFGIPFRLMMGLYLTFILLIFQLFILYGLYNLRRHLYLNFFRSTEFEFEKK